MYRLKKRAPQKENSDGSSNPQGSWVLVKGDDVLTPQVVEQHSAWEQMQRIQSTLVYTDHGFAPGPRAVDGRDQVEVKLDVFKATMSESSGGHSGNDVGEAPLCQCGEPARMGVLRREDASNGRPYWRCAGRVCKFFELADRASTLAAIDLTWAHLGPPKWVVVGDEGFRPEHLRQGAVGDCWFMSALAVVAERHDLLEKVLPNLNEGLQSGCHEVRLFLDGFWTSALIDSHFPMANPAKQRRKDETGLAFGRASEHQLWVPLIEKAYARAHGAYDSISGGQVSEAMLDLTGCPTESVHFQVPGFDKDLFWGRLLSFLQSGFPIGCGTSSETIEELGLVGQHAYSVLEASERPQLQNDFDGACCIEDRMVKVRNPWGEWTRRENDDIMRSLGAAITGDGAFWMRYEDFLKGFSSADICKAQQGWHAHSFDVGFAGGGVGTRRALRLRALKRAECYIMLIQPTERGARLKRARGYYLNDVSLAILDSKTGAMELVVLGGARRDVTGDSLFLDPDREYIIVPFSFKARPGACVVRVFSSNLVEVHLVDRSPEQATQVWKSLHSFALLPQMDFGSRVQRMVHHVYDGTSGSRVGQLLLIEGESLALGILINEQMQDALEATVLLEANHMIARTSHGLSEGKPRPDDGIKPNKENKKPSGKREPKDAWHEFSIQSVVPPKSQQLLFVMIPCMRQKGDYDLSLIELHAEAAASAAATTGPSEHPFSAVALCQQALRSLPESENVGGGQPGADDAEFMLAISASLAESQGQEVPAGRENSMQLEEERGGTRAEDDELMLAISASLAESQDHKVPAGREKSKELEDGKKNNSFEDVSNQIQLREPESLEEALALNQIQLREPESLEEALDQVQLLAALSASISDPGPDNRDKAHVGISDDSEDEIAEKNALEIALAMSLNDSVDISGAQNTRTDKISESACVQNTSTDESGESAGAQDTSTDKSSGDKNGAGAESVATKPRGRWGRHKA